MATFRVVPAHARGAATSYVHASGAPDAPAARGGRMELDDEDAPARIAVPGEAVASSAQFMRGHGCYLDAARGDIVSSLSGTLDKVNKLISVRPVRTRYRPEVGDLVIGRITEVQSRRWKVNIGAKTDASLQLSSINLPGGVQRKKLESDELQMRSFFQEGDLVVAEVQSVFQDGSVGLHTRSLRYGKLRNGALVIVPPVLVRRHKSHFLTLPSWPADGVDLVLGLNGWVWVSKHVEFDVAKAEGEGADLDEVEGPHGRGIAMDIDGVYSDINEVRSPPPFFSLTQAMPAATRESIAQVVLILTVLAHDGRAVSEAALTAASAALQAARPAAPAVIEAIRQSVP